MSPTGFRTFLLPYAVNAAGSALSAGALPLIAVTALDAENWQVSILAAAGLVAGAFAAIPIGGVVDSHSRRNIMIAANFAAFASLATVPAAAFLGWLTFTHLCLVAAIQSVTAIAYTSAAGAYVKDLVPQPHLASANSRLDSVGWLTQTAGPPAGGLLIGAAGATTTVLADAVSYLVSAFMLRRTPTLATTPQTAAARRDLLGGWRFITGHSPLRRLYANAMLFGGAIMWSSPLLAVLILRDLGATAWQYGLALGVPCLGGLAGAILSPRLASRFGQHRIFVLSGLLRTPWLILLPFLGDVYQIMACDTLLLFAAGLFNPLFAAYRATVAPTNLVGRVIAAWALGSRTIQPLFIIIGGAVAALAGTRASLIAAGALCIASSLMMPTTQTLHRHLPKTAATQASA